ncbi:MAG: response regulator, partial [bacterium]|nr:response regulator [bacterium]
ELAPGGASFTGKKLYMLVSYEPESNRYLIWTRSNGFYIYDYTRGTLAPFPTGVDDYLKENRLYHGIRFRSGRFAAATLRGGLVIFNTRGALVDIYDTTSGLPTNNVKSVYEDPGGNLWLAMNNGIARIEYASPFSIYDRRNGLKGMVLAVAGHQGELCIGTTNGLFYLNTRGEIREEPKITSNCWSLFSMDDTLIAATSEGIWHLEKNTSRKLSPKNTYVLLPSQQDANRIWVGCKNGAMTLYRSGSQWKIEHDYKNITQSIRTIVEPPGKNLWLGTTTQGVIRIEAAKSFDTPVITNYGKNHGLPGGGMNVFFAAGRVMVTTQKGLYRYDEQNRRFVRDFIFGKDFGDGTTSIFRIVEDKQARIWFTARNRNYLAKPQPDETYQVNSTLFKRLPIAQVNVILPEGSSVWFGRNDNLIRYEINKPGNYRAPFPALIRSVRLINDKTVIFDGFEKNMQDGSITLSPALRYKDRGIRFQYAAPFFEEETRTRYSYFLEGSDEKWSQWSLETQKDYTNIDPGGYTFQVQAKNIYDRLSRKARFSFKILPPWYRTIWAYILYAMGILFFMFLVVKWRSRQHETERKRLEKIIRDRTHEIAGKNQILEKQSQQLKELDEVKSRFFANVSHEFRTPLTLIMGPLEQILAKYTDPDLQNQSRLMLRNSQRLLNLVNQLLELAKFDSGKAKLHLTNQNIVPFIKSVVFCFESLARQNNIDFTFNSEEEKIAIYCDLENLERIITNLLANAFNYTPKGGRITVSLRRAGASKAYPGGTVELEVRDTGTGIPAHQLPHIFDRFYRGGENHGEERNGMVRKGTGIGLALTRELVELHHGTIRVESSYTPGETGGTAFLINLPMETAHLAPGEVEDTPPLPYRTVCEPHEAEPIAAAETPPATPESTGTSGAGEKEKKHIVLVVEDNPDVRGYIRNALEREFYIKEAADGEEGIEEARRIVPDLIISDIMMPGKDGYELCKTLKTDIATSHIPIILLTAKIGEADVLAGLRFGADDYITKPFNTRVLTVRVRNLIEVRAKLQLKRRNQMEMLPRELPVLPIDDKFYRELTGIIQTHIKDPQFSVRDLAKKMGMGRTTLYKKVQAITGEPPTDFIRNYRLQRAAELLKNYRGTIADLALQVGFSNASYFTGCFKERFQRLPSQYRATHLEGGGAAMEDGEDIESLDSPIPGRETAGVETEQAEPDGEKDLVLVVEDSEDARHYIRGALEPVYRVEEASGGRQGIEAALACIPALIISDIMMPEVDGYELCRTLKNDSRSSHIPIILLTAKVSDESVIAGLETGAEDYITKPFNREILLARIGNLLNLRRQLQLKRTRQMTLEPDREQASALDEEFYRDMQRVIEKNLDDSEFGVEELCKALYMGRTTLYRKILALSGETPSEFIRSYRLKRAAQLLRRKTGTVLEVAVEVGFSSSSHFAKCFREKFHQLPSEYLDNH